MEMDSNPYGSPASTSVSDTIDASWSLRVRAGMKTLLWWLLYFYPMIVTSSLHAAWGLSALKLGRPPIPYREYPESFLITVCTIVAGLGAVGIPLMIPAGFVFSFSQPFGQRDATKVTTSMRLTSAAIYVLMFAVAARLHLGDPFEAAKWFWD